MRLPILVPFTLLIISCHKPAEPVASPVGQSSAEERDTAGAVPAQWPNDATTATDPDGKPFDLAPMWQDRPTVVVFYRGHWCEFCVKQLSELQKRHAEIEKCANLVAISADGPDKTRQLRDELKITFPLLSDPDLEVMEALGVRHPGHQFARPAVIIVGPQGIISYSYVGLDPSDRPPVEHFLGSLGCTDGTPPEQQKKSAE